MLLYVALDQSVHGSLKTHPPYQSLLVLPLQQHNNAMKCSGQRGRSPEFCQTFTLTTSSSCLVALLPFSQNSSPCEESSDRQCILEVNKCHWNEQSTSKRVKISSSWVKQYCILKIYYAFEHGHCETVITINSRLHSVLIIYVNCE